MNKKRLKICWPNKLTTIAEEGEDWFEKAQKAFPGIALNNKYDEVRNIKNTKNI